MNIGIIGAGAWGKALAVITKKAGNNVILWSYDTVSDSELSNKDIKTTLNMADLENCDAWLIVTPAAFFRETVQKSRLFYKNQPVIICTKGLEDKTYKFMSEILNEELPECIDFGVLSGPQFAKEVYVGVKTGSTLAGTERVLIAGRKIFSELYLEETDDVIGAEICGVGKNAVALISGFISVKIDGENEKALVFTRAWNEVVDFGVKNGAKVKTFLGLCGLGDLFLSATSKTSRNYSAGVAIANNIPISDETVEGIYALKGLVNRGSDVNLPVLTAMHSEMGI